VKPDDFKGDRESAYYIHKTNDVVTYENIENIFIMYCWLGL